MEQFNKCLQARPYSSVERNNDRDGKGPGFDHKRGKKLMNN
jgi:hypothetical protein